MGRGSRIGRWFLLGLLALVLAGFAVPAPMVIPVQGASSRDWNSQTFWYEPWGRSGVHKGIDIFAGLGTPVLSASHGLVLYRGHWSLGGNVLLVLGPRWRLHYYAHLQSSSTSAGTWLTAGAQIGTVGDTGNARGKPAHLHYSVITLLPHLWRWDASTQGWKKMFFLDPGALLTR